MDRQWGLVKLRVRYQETDQMGIVYHANYLNWFEIGRTEWIRGEGISYQMLEKQGLLLPVVDLNVSYRRPAYYDDIIRIYTRMARFSEVRIDFEVKVCRQPEDTLQHDQRASQPIGEVLVEGKTSHVWMDSSWKPVRLDRKAPDLYKIIEGC